MGKRRASSLVKTMGPSGYHAMLGEVVDLVEWARRGSARAVNAVMTATYWQVGARIVQHEQHGADRAEYGAELLRRLARDLGERFGQGFSRQNLQSMRAFYLAYPPERICQTASGKLAEAKRQTASGKFATKRYGYLELSPPHDLHALAATFPLSWSHYVLLMSVRNEYARQFYESEALRGGWSVKQLDRQINSSFYERAALSRDKMRALTHGARRMPEDAVSAEEEIKDPFVLEFLGLKDEYSETDLEEALIGHMESFLLELGSDFAFVGRQRRLRIGNTWFRVDLLFFHRKLRCLVIIDLKTGRFSHEDAGQMHLYCNYAMEHWTNVGENPPVGLILCKEQDEAVARYALDRLPNKIMAAEYRMKLPDENLIAAELKRTSVYLESRLRGGKSRMARRRLTPPKTAG
jgi:predicted nuclease of restriction endonuclease-like (RecB) superfamily